MSSGVQDLQRRRNDPGYLNWLAVGDAIMLLGDGLRKYAEIKMKEFHALITTNVGGPRVQCNCKCTPGKKPNPHGRTTHCVWAQELKKFHVFKRKNDIPWHQSNSSRWDDPNFGYWEIAKLFMSELGKDWAKTKDPSNTDVGPLLNLLIFCNHFKIQQALLEAVKDWRNKCAHAPDRTLSDMDRQAAFKDIEKLMNDPELMTNKDVQACRPDIKSVEKADVAILEDVELEILREYQRIRDFEERNMTEKLVEVTANLTRKLPEEISDKVTEKITEKVADKITEKVADKVTEKITNKETEKNTENVAEMVSFFLKILLFLISNVPAEILLYFVAYLMFSQVGDKSVILDEGCPTAMIKSPISQLNYQEFDFSSYLAYKREGFVGRKWFFLELESIFEENPEIAGVLITAEPGSGKSALMSQLICSPFSSLLIYDNTIGYHLCEYSENGKRDGARFVRNLVDQIAARLPEYAEHVMNNKQLQTELDKHCQKDSVACFFAAIVGPLRKIKQPNDFRFIIIDAIDECFESDMKTSEIMDILNSKIIHFPKWLKVVLTSRNLTLVTSKLPRLINRTSLFAADERNVQDIRYYVSRFISQNSDFSDRLLAAVDIRSRAYGMKIFLDEVITRAEGNFLFVKTTLQYMNDTKGKIDFQSLPTSLFDLYNIFFNRQFGEDGFEPFKSLFEVLVAVYSPLQSRDIEEILENDYEVANVPKRFELVSCFLRFGRDGTVRIYHQSFAEWLKDQRHVLSINLTRGHQNIAKFLLRGLREKHVNATFEKLTELFMHILSGKDLKMQKTAMALFNITAMRESQTNQSILHYLVTQSIIYRPVLDFFLQKFETVDLLDARNKTPAFYATSEGAVWSLQSCINNGADIGSYLKGYTELHPLSVVVRNKGIEEFSLMHLTVTKGYTDVVELLLQSNVSYPEYSKNYPSPLHLAAGNGNLELVKLFYSYGAIFDQITLHHAAARNHLAVVKFLLSSVGLRDTCGPCEPKSFAQLSLNPIMQEVHSYFCETALHAAASRELVNIVKVLLEFGKEALECKHHSGKTVLIDAVERNNTEMVDLLLDHGANVTNDCGRKILKDSNKQMCSLYSMYQEEFLYTVYCVNDSCDCGNRALHVSAKFGLWTMAEKLTSGQTKDLIDLENCDEDDAVDIAIINDYPDFVQKTNSTLNKVGQHFVASKMLRLAVKYCSVKIAKILLNHPASFKYEVIWNFLRIAVTWSPWYKLKTTMSSPSRCLKAFQDNNLSEVEKSQKESERRLNIIKLLTETYQDESLLLNKRKDDGMTLLHIAALLGFDDAVKYLVGIGADTFLKDNNGDTPLIMALQQSTVNHLRRSVYRCYTTDDGQFSLCNTRCYDETVRFLIQSQKASISKCDDESAFLLKNVLVNKLPLSLYALMKIGVDLNCRFNDFSTAWLLHLQTGAAEVSEVLKMFEVDVSPKCKVPFLDSELHLMVYLSQSDDFGNFFKPSLNKKRSPLQRLIDRHPRGVRILDECYDAKGYLPIHVAAKGGNIDAIKWLKNVGANTQAKTRDGLTALDISIWSLEDRSARTHLFERFVINPRYHDESFEELLRIYFDTSPKNYSSDISPVSSTLFPQHPILHLAAEFGLDEVKQVYAKALEIAPALKKNHFLLLDEQNVNGHTALHIAAYWGLEDVVNYLVRLGADVNVRDQDGNIPLWIALIKSVISIERNPDRRCYTTNDALFTSCQTTPHDEIGRNLISSYKSSFSKCDAESVDMLNLVIKKRMPLSLYALLKKGVDVNCKGNESLSPFSRHLILGGQQISEVLKIFEVDVSVKCGVPFMSSELHLISYVSVSGDFGNFFKPSKNKKRSPLQRLIDRHPRGVRILDECYDADGFLPIHRAAQGGNLDALQWFKSVEVNTQLKTRSLNTLMGIQKSLTALDIAILYLRNNYYATILSSFSNAIPTHPSYRNESFEELLLTFFQTSEKHYRLDICFIPCASHCILHRAATYYELDAFTEVHNKALEIVPSLTKNPFLLLDEQDASGQTPLHIAAYRGSEDVVKYLVRLGADVNVRDQDGNTPLLVALKVSPVNSVERNQVHRCYTTNDGLFTSCKTTPLDEIGRSLISSQKSSVSKCDAESVELLNLVIGKRMPLSLYALLKEGVDVNCKDNESLSSLLRHLISRGQQISEVLKMFDVDVSVKCGVPLVSSELHFISYVSASGDFGNFFSSSLNKKRSPLQRLIDRHPRGARILDECYDAEGFLPIHRAAQGGNIDAIKWMKNVGANIQAKRHDGFTPLDISMTLLRTQSNPRYQRACMEELLRSFFETSPKNYSSDISSVSSSSFPRRPLLHLATGVGFDVVKQVYNKVLEIIPALKENIFLLLDEQDVNGLTPLYHAAYSGSENIVKYLVELGANINVEDKDRNTPLLVALIESPVNSIERNQDHRCYTTNDGLLTSCETTPHDEIGRYLISSQKSIISKCDAESVELLNLVIEKRMPLSLYALLKKGVDVNCKGNESFSPFLRHLILGGQQISEVFKTFEVDVSVKCGVPFTSSELHLISYQSVSTAFGNFFKPSLNKKLSPLQRLIDRHPRGVRILDECYDAEGFLPIHRAAQGGNLFAIKWFKSVGVNTQAKTRNGVSALDISITLLRDEKNSRYRSQCFEELLRTFFYTSRKSYSSDFSSVSFSSHGILHVAAGTGLDVITDVYNKALEIMPALKKEKLLIVDEQDVSRNTPLHIAAIFGLEDVVKYLVRLGADINIKNMCGSTPLLAALESPVKSLRSGVHQRCHTTNDGLFSSCKATPYDEIVRFLISSQKSIISKCDDESEYLLNQFIEKRMSLSLYALLKRGVDVNCKLKYCMRPFLRHLRRGGEEVSEVLKIFNVEVFAECWIPFMHSELHLIAYISVSGDIGNFFKPSLNKKRSPLQRLIDRHPKGVRILDECYDAEGYLPIHRAAQRGNVDAIKWFKRVGVNTQAKTRRGLTALDISILNRGENFTLKNYGDLLAP